MQKAFQTGASIALKFAVFGFTKYLQSWKLECFVASLNLQHQSKQDQTELRCECEVSQKINSEFHSIPRSFFVSNHHH
jgi:hypothetical protein